MPEPKVAAIVLNFNGKALTLDTVASLRAMRYPSFDVVVVDNGSTDGSHEAVGEAFPEAIRLRTEKNLWIAGGLNLGIAWAMARDYDYLLLLNNDIEVDPAMLDELVAVAEHDPKIGCVGPKCYYFGDRDRLWSAGGILRFKESVTRERGNGEPDCGQFDRDEEVSYINGCAMLVRRAAMAAVGPWDTAYNLGVEDADWCMRSKLKGFTCWYAHRAVLWHKVSFTVGGYTPGRTFQTGRSSAIFLRRFGKPWNWLTFLLFLAAAIPVAYLRELRHRNQAAAIAKLRGVIAGLKIPLAPPPDPSAFDA